MLSQVQTKAQEKLNKFGITDIELTDRGVIFEASDRSFINETKMKTYEIILNDDKVQSICDNEIRNEWTIADYLA